MRLTHSFPLTIALLILVAGCPRNRPPDKPPAPSGPSQGYRDSSYVFSTVPTDPDVDEVSIRFAWGNGDTSSWTAPASSGKAQSVSHIWDSAGAFSVSAQARDLNEAQSAWSDALIASIGVASQPPNRPPVPSGRTTGHVGVEYEYRASASDPDGDSVAIQFSWGDGDTSDWTALDANGTCFTESHTWLVAGTTHIATRARDKHGLLSVWSLPLVLSLVADNQPPETPVAPAGSTECFLDSVYSYACATTDPDDDRVQYRFRWGDGDTSRWTDFVESGFAALAEHAWGELGSYAVRAQARDEFGAVSAWSESLAVCVDPGFPSRVVAEVEVPGAPGAMAILPSGEHLYVPLLDSGRTAVVRTSDNTVVAQVPAGRTPSAAEALPTGDRVYVANYRDHTVSVIRVPDNTVVKNLPVGRYPAAVGALPDGKRVYVCNGQDTLVTIIDTEMDSVSGTIRTEEQPCCIGVLPSGEYIYVGCYWHGWVQVVKASDDSVVAGLRVSDPRGIAVLETGDRVYVSNHGRPEVYVIKVADNTILTTVDLDGDPDVTGIAALPGRDYVYVADRGKIVVIRTRDNSVARSISLGYSLGYLTMHPDGERVYVTRRDRNRVVVLGY